ncbi:MAG: ABC transporter permease subunit [Gammaproteobacteria bacterium]|nr:ABC transporter permease subunit [Gammaproteobacteria bacterium]
MMIAVVQRELRSLFGAPLAWLVLGALQFISAYLFFIHLEDFLLQQEKLRAAGSTLGLSAFVIPRFFAPLSVLLLFVAPLLGMRLIASERSGATLRLLLSAPVGLFAVVLGKYLAALCLLSLLIVLIGFMPLTLSFWVAIDIGALLLAAFGTWLCAAMGLALGLFFSALTKHPVSAAVASLSMLLLLWLIGSGNDAQLTEVTRFLSLPHHLQSFFSGLLDTRDVGYFIVWTALCLALATKQLAGQRESP